MHGLLDAVGALVHLVGATAVDTDARDASAARAAGDRWRRHLVLGVEHPEAAGASDSGDVADGAGARRGAPLAARDWTGAVRWAQGERQRERAHVLRTTGELRDTVWHLVQGLHGVVGAEADAGRRTGEAVRRVERAVRESDPEAVREAALGAVGELAALLAERERAREQQVAELGRELRALDAALDEARRASESDALTGLGNRRAFDAALAHAVALHGLWRAPVCLLLGDVDGLKAVNDGHGHPAGDEALRRVAGRIAATCLRRSDVLARIGGDEFGLVLRDVTEDEAARIGQRLVDAVRAAGGDPALPPVGLSVGVAALADGDDAASWVARADAALYRAKRSGKGRVERAGG